MRIAVRSHSCSFIQLLVQLPARTISHKAARTTAHIAAYKASHTSFSRSQMCSHSRTAALALLDIIFFRDLYLRCGPPG